MRRIPLAALQPLALGCALALTLSCGGGDGGGGGTEPTPNPTPTLVSLSRDTATAGLAPFAITVKGTGFVPGVIGSVDSLPRVTARLTDSTLTITLTTGDLATATDRHLRVTNPEPGGGTSGELTFHVLTAPPTPVLDSISPDSVIAGDSVALHLKAFGHGFSPGAVLRVNGTPVPTTRVSDTLLTTILPGGDIDTQGSLTITAFKSAPGGGTSAGRPFVILPVPPPPAITGTDPDTVIIGPDTIALTLHGSHFAGVDSVGYNNQGNSRVLPASAASDSLAVVPFPLGWLSSLGVPAVRLHGPRGWGSYYNNLEAVNPVPVIDSVRPDTLDAVQAVDTLVVYGHGFVPGMSVDGLGTVTTLVQDFGHIRVIVPHERIMGGATALVWVFDSWDYHFSDSVSVALRTVAPVVDSIRSFDPNADSVGAKGASIAVFGRHLSWGGAMVINGIPRTTYVADSTVAWAGPDSSEMTSPDTLTVAFQNPAPGGGLSAAYPYVIRAPNPPPAIDSATPTAARSDSGPQVLTLRGHGFRPGTVVGPPSPFLNGLIEDTVPTTVLNDSVLTFLVRPSWLEAGRVFDVVAQAPAPTGRPSAPTHIPVWTTGVEQVTHFIGTGLHGLAPDSARGVVYQTLDSAGAGILRAVDPVSGATIRELALPAGTGRIVPGPAGDVLYVLVDGDHKVSRVDIDAWQLAQTIELPTDTLGGGAFLFQWKGAVLVPSPTSSTTFAVALTGSFGLGYLVRVYDDVTPRPGIDTISTGAYAGRFFGDTLVLLAQSAVHDLVLDSTGAHTLDSIPTAGTYFNFTPTVFLSRTRVAASGALIDPTTGVAVRTDPDLAGTPFPSADPNTYFVARGVGQFGYYRTEVSLVDLATGIPIRTVGFDHGDVGPVTLTPGSRIMLGTPGANWTILQSVLSDP